MALTLIKSTKSEKGELVALTNARIDVIMRMVLLYEDGLILPMVVAGGPGLWRQRFLAAMRGCAVDEAIADGLFHFFSLKWIQRSMGTPAKAYLDAVEPVSPPTQQEIAQAWEMDSVSSPEGWEYFYGEQSRGEILEQLVKTIH